MLKKYNFLAPLVRQSATGQRRLSLSEWVASARQQRTRCEFVMRSSTPGHFWCTNLVRSAVVEPRGAGRGKHDSRKGCVSKPENTLDRFWDVPLRDLLDLLEATPAGLTSEEAKQRLRRLRSEQPGRGIAFRCSAELAALLCQSARPHSSGGQRHLARAG